MDGVIVTTVVGDGTKGPVDGPALNARFQPRHIAVASNGAIYFSDMDGSIKVLENGQVRTVAGNGTPGFADGPALQAQMNQPNGIIIAPNGNIYFADGTNHRIRVIENGQVRTVAGSGIHGFADGPALQARFYNPCGIKMSFDGAIYIADLSNNRIRMLKDGQVRTVAGSGTAGFVDGLALQAQMHNPWAVTISPNGDIYFSDRESNRIRAIKDGRVRTVAGSGSRGFVDGPALKAQLNAPMGIIAAEDGVIYFSDRGNNRIRILEGDQVRTIAGSGVKGFVDGSAIQSQLNEPGGIDISSDGDVYIADSNNFSIRALRSHVSQKDVILKGSLNTDMKMEFSSALFDLHRCFIEIRCPALLPEKPHLESQPLDKDSLEAFRSYLYTNEFPPEASHPHIYIGLSYIFQQCKKYYPAMECLSRLLQVQVGTNDFTAQTLLRLYEYALTLPSFADGIAIVRYLLYAHKSSIEAKEMFQLFGTKHQMALVELVQVLMSNQAPVNPLDSIKDHAVHDYLSAKAETHGLSLRKTLIRLFDSKRGADFEILIDGEEPVKCHSFILFDRWPYFANFNQNMREATEKRLKLPAPGKQHGMHPIVLNAILEVCYKGCISMKTRHEISPTIALYLLSAHIYFSTGAHVEVDEESVGVDDIFSDLWAYAEKQVSSGVNAQNCVDLFIMAHKMGSQQVVARAKEVILANRKAIFSEAKGREQLNALPFETLADLCVDLALS